MTILRLTHDEGVQRVSALLLEENLIPVIGSGFTKGCASQNGMVPDGSLATELMKKIICEFKPINLASSDFNKTSERFFLSYLKSGSGNSSDSILQRFI